MGNNSALGTGTVTLGRRHRRKQPGNTNQDALLDLEINNLNIANEFVILNDNGGGKQIRLDNGGAAAHNGTISGEHSWSRKPMRKQLHS